MNRTLTIAEMALRELSRRRSVVLILLLLPLAFYLGRRGDHEGQSIRFVCLGLGWAQSTAALFAGSAARAVEPRLRLSGYRSRHLVLGRLIALWALSTVISAPYFLLIRFDQHNVSYGGIALIMALTVVVATSLGLSLSAVLPRELEGMLVLLVIFGLQMILDPSGFSAKLLPFWYSREIADYAVDHTGDGSLLRGLADGAFCATVLVSLVALASTVRLKQRSHIRVTSA